MKACSTCGIEKPLDQFHTDKSASDGRIAQCKQCRCAKTQAYKDANRGKVRDGAKAYYRANKEKHQDGVRRYRQKNTALFMVASAKGRAEKAGLAFDLDAHVGDIQQRIDAGFCELTGLPFSREASGRLFDAPSIDRIEPSRGYVYSNIRIICLMMNCALGPWGESKLRKVMEAWLRQPCPFPEGELADTDGRDASTEGLQRSGQHGCEPQDGGRRDLLPQRQESADRPRGANQNDQLADANSERSQGLRTNDGTEGRQGPDIRSAGLFDGAGPWSDLEWLPCTDGKQRPTRARLQYVFDGLPTRMVDVCPTQDEEKIDASAQTARPDKALRGLRLSYDAQEVQEHSGGQDKVQVEKILRPAVHGEGAREGDLPKSIPLARESQQINEAELRSVWQHGEAPCPPHRREPAQQRSIEFDDFMQLLPSAHPLAQLSGDTATAEAVRALLEAVDETGALLHTSDAGSQVWRSAFAESEDWFRMGFAKGGWIIAPLHPLAHGVPSRVAKLRAAGNAIVPQVASAFIQACLTEGQ